MIIPVILATLFTSRYLELIIGLVPGSSWGLGRRDGSFGVATKAYRYDGRWTLTKPPPGITNVNA